MDTIKQTIDKKIRYFLERNEHEQTDRSWNNSLGISIVAQMIMELILG